LELTDADLVRQCLTGDHGAWEWIVRQHQSRIYNLAYRFTGRFDEAEDLTQEIFLKVYRTLGSYRPESGSLVTWMVSVGRNHLIDHYRKFKTERSQTGAIDDEYERAEENPERYLSPTEALQKKEVEFYYLGYYLKWVPQECYYYAVENCGFQANPERSVGTYSKYDSLDDRIDGFFYFTSHIKFGIGKATTDAVQEIRTHHLTREDGVALVRRFDGEFPGKYAKEIFDYLGITEEHFWEVIDRFRSPHLWKRENGAWKLRHVVS